MGDVLIPGEPLRHEQAPADDDIDHPSAFSRQRVERGARNLDGRDASTARGVQFLFQPLWIEVVIRGQQATMCSRIYVEYDNRV